MAILRDDRPNCETGFFDRCLQIIPMEEQVRIYLDCRLRYAVAAGGAQREQRAPGIVQCKRGDDRQEVAPVRRYPIRARRGGIFINQAIPLFSNTPVPGITTPHPKP